MVLNAIFDFVMWVFELITQAMPSLAPTVYSVSTTLANVLSVGVWVIGDEMWSVFMVTITGWLTFKLTWGIILFIYRLIPFC